MSCPRFALSLHPLDTMDSTTNGNAVSTVFCTNIATSFCAKSQTLLLVLTNFHIWCVYALKPAEMPFLAPFVFCGIFYGQKHKTLYRALQGCFRGLYHALRRRFKFKEWDIDKKISIQRNLQISGIKTTKCCYSPYFHLTQKLTFDTLQFIIDTIISQNKKQPPRNARQLP